MAKTFFERCVSHTYNPILDVYARLNAIRQNKDASQDYITKNIAALVKMAHRDRYAAHSSTDGYAYGCANHRAHRHANRSSNRVFRSVS